MAQSKEVALLIGDLNKAAEISATFREWGVITHLYESLQDLWKGLFELRPDLIVVDLMKMNEYSLMFKNHPLVKSEQFNIVFFGDNESTPLLSSTNEIFNYGFINGDYSLKVQLSAILKRVSHYESLKRKLDSQKDETDRYSRQLSGVTKNVQDITSKERYQKVLDDACNYFDHALDPNGFLSMANKYFQTADYVEKFSFVELSDSNKRLVSPPFSSMKYRRVPALWLGTPSDGISNSGVDLACNVAADLLGGDLISLLVKGLSGHAEKILFLKLKDPEWLDNFNWDLFEKYLSAMNSVADVKNLKESREVEKSTVSGWWMLEKVDDLFFKGVLEGGSFGEADDDYTLINVDFSSLKAIALEKIENRFYFNTFFDDFVMRLRRHLSFDFSVSSIEFPNLTFLVESQFAEDLFSTLKKVQENYPFWRYFDELDQVMTAEISPSVRMIPLSSHAILEFFASQKPNEVLPVEDSYIRPSRPEVTV